MLVAEFLQLSHKLKENDSRVRVNRPQPTFSYRQQYCLLQGKRYRANVWV